MADKQKVFGPYSPVRRAGSMYFTAGHLGVDMATKTVDPDIRVQTARALDALAETLASVDLSLSDVIKVTIFVTDMADFAAINEVYVARFAEPRPARSTVAIKELPRVATNGPVKIEIEAVAARQGM